MQELHYADAVSHVLAAIYDSARRSSLPLIVSASALLALCLVFRLPTRRTATLSRFHLQHVLLHFIVPIGSIWPPHYARLELNDGLCTLGLGTFLNDLIKAVVELRSPQLARAIVLGDALDLDGLVLGFYAEWRLRIATLWFIVRNELPLMSLREAESFATLQEDVVTESVAHRTILQQSSPDRWRGSSPDAYQPLLWTNAIYILDGTPRYRQERVLCGIKPRVLPGRSALVLLTTTASRPPILSVQGVLMCLILANSPALIGHSTSYSSSPLFADLSSVINTLTTGSDALELQSVRNISLQYAAALRHVSITSSSRKSRVMALFEAEYLTFGRMTRWEVVVHRRPE